MLLLFESLPAISHLCVLVEPGDTAAALEQALGLSIVTSLFDAVRFPHDDYVPSFEVIEDHGDSYEMVFITDDDTGSTVLFIPKQADIDAVSAEIFH